MIRCTSCKETEGIAYEEEKRNETSKDGKSKMRKHENTQGNTQENTPTRRLASKGGGGEPKARIHQQEEIAMISHAYERSEKARQEKGRKQKRKAGSGAVEGYIYI